jgi:2-polyprenyl-3-methyl-5-hydroxy-6-metoxy-1,4-benzoquinol methylase
MTCASEALCVDGTYRRVWLSWPNGIYWQPLEADLPGEERGPRALQCLSTPLLAAIDPLGNRRMRVAGALLDQGIGDGSMSEREERYWSRFASSYDTDQQYVVGEAIQQAVTRKLSGERDLGEVIEFGCGGGYFTKALAGNATRVVATDLSDEMVEAARAQLKEFQNITIEKADCKNTTYPRERFDTAVMVNVVHFIRDPDKCLEEGYRILKDGGLLILADYTGYSMNWLQMMSVGIRFLLRWGEPPRYAKSRLSPGELGSLVKDAGFTVEEVEIIGEQMKALYLKGRKI